METEDADAVARVPAALDAEDTGSMVRVFEQSTHTVEEAAVATCRKAGQIVKALLYIAANQPVLLLVAGDRRVDDTVVARLLGLPRKRLRMAKAGEVVALTGYSVGGVLPLGHSRPLETLVDESLGRYDEVVAAGAHRMPCFPSRLRRLYGPPEAESCA